MDTYESFFREKSHRRSRRRAREKTIKGGILFILLGSIATAIYLSVAGLPRQPDDEPSQAISAIRSSAADLAPGVARLWVIAGDPPILSDMADIARARMCREDRSQETALFVENGGVRLHAPSLPAAVRIE
jgi:hypothetical protein